MDKGDFVEAHIEKVWLSYYKDEATHVTIRVNRIDASPVEP